MYTGFTERIEFTSNLIHISQFIYYTYDSSNYELNIYLTSIDTYYPNSDFLCIFATQSKTQLFLINMNEMKCYVNERLSVSFTSSMFRITNLNLPLTDSTPNIRRAFDYVYKRPNS